MTGAATPTKVSPSVRAIMTERIRPAGAGIPLLILFIVVGLIDIGLFVLGAILGNHAGDGLLAGIVIGVAVPVMIGDSIAFRGLTQVQPGEARVVQLFGRYNGTVRSPGLCWVNPFTERRKVSTRIRNYETQVAKVNDADGNPIEIAAVVVWQVEDTAQALYEVDDFARFVDIQTETAVRHVASTHPYDAHEDGQLSLRVNATEITTQLTGEISERVSSAGVKIIESRLTRLSFAPEIARRCCAGSRRAPSSPPARRSWKAPSAWSRWRSRASRSVGSWTSTPSARRRWCPTCWSSSAASRTRNLSSTPAPCTTDGSARKVAGESTLWLNARACC
jgi:hypothetical protein